METDHLGFVDSGDYSEGLFSGIHYKAPHFQVNKGDPYSEEQFSKRLFVRRNTLPFGKRSGRNSPSRQSTRWLLQHILFDSKKLRRSQTYSERKTTKSVFIKETFQDGNPQHCPKSNPTRRLGGGARFKGCIPPHSNCPRTSKISEVLLQGHSFPVQGTSLRTKNCTKSFHQGDSSIGRTSSQVRLQNPHVPGRLDPSSPIKNGAESASGDLSSGHPGPGVSHQLGEIPVKSQTEPSLPRGQFTAQNRTGKPNREQIREVEGIIILSDEEEEIDGRGDTAIVGTHGVNDRPSTPCTSVLETATDLSSGPLETIKSEPSSKPTGSVTSVATSQMVDGISECPQGSDTGVCSTFHNRGYRCQQNGLGSSLSEEEGPGNLEQTVARKAHQHLGDVGSRAGSLPVSDATTGETSSHQKRQLHGGHVPEQGGGYSIPSPLHVDLEDSTVVSEEQHSDQSNPYCRDTQHDCRPSLQETSHTHRMDAEQGSSSTYLQPIRDSQYRPVCIRSEPSVASFLLVDSEQSSSGDRRLLSAMGQLVRVCIPTDLSHSKSVAPTESYAAVLQDHPYSSPLAEEVLVPSDTGVDSSQPCDSTPQTRLVKTAKGTVLPSGSRETSVNSICSEQLSDGTSQLSESAERLVQASLREGSQRDYAAKYKVFSDWCSVREIDPSNTSVTEIINFLAHLLDKNLKYNTIAGYRSMLSHFHRPVDGCPVGSHPEVKKAMKGVFNTRPPIPKLPPSWDLDIVLEALRKEPFEPLESISVEFLTWKTCFLLAVASARRGDDIAKLSIKQGFFNCNKEEAVFIPSQLLKQDRPSHLGGRIQVGAFPQDTRICPVRALQTYLKATADRRGDIESLFLTCVQPYHSPTSQTINRWIVLTITEAYRSCNQQIPTTTGHSTRCIGPSKALFKGMDVKDILSAADWSKEKTFRKFYCKTVTSKKDFSTVVLE